MKNTSKLPKSSVHTVKIQFDSEKRNPSPVTSFRKAVNTSRLSSRSHEQSSRVFSDSSQVQPFDLDEKKEDRSIEIAALLENKPHLQPIH